MKYDIFLSYSHSDAEIASGLYTQLDNSGYICFMAEKEINAAQEWSSVIHKAITESRLLLILITPRSQKSLWVAAEAGAAWALKKKVIPALMFVDIDDLIQIINKWQSYTVETPTQIDKLISELPKYNIKKPEEDNKLININAKDNLKTIKNEGDVYKEDFFKVNIWKNLTKIGQWTYFSFKHLIKGKGSFNFLLSNNEYGKNNFHISANILFKEYEHSSFGVNAGIVLGWSSEGNNFNYYNLLFTGERMLLEETDTNSYYNHLDSGVDFILEMDRKYEIDILYKKGILKVSIDGNLLYSIHIEKGILGNVGLRPWRSEMYCSQFEVVEII